MLSQNKGVTLIILTITIIILGILVSVSINVGTRTYKDMLITAYVAKMNMIQSRVNVISQKVANGDTSYDEIGKTIPQLTNAQKDTINSILNGTSSDDYKYYDQTELAKFGVDNIDEDVIINLKTKVIYSMVGIEYNGLIHYNQYTLPNGIQPADYIALETRAPEFTLEKDNYGLTVAVNITNIIYDEKINGADIYYGEVTDADAEPVAVNFWQPVSGTSFTVTKTAKYAVKMIDKNGGETIKTVDVVTCNAPELTSGMIPVIYENGSWKMIEDNNKGKWFDYAEGKWANIMLNDGLVVETDGTISKMGSMFVWIPRYAYQITSNYHKGGTGVKGNINVKFLKNLTQVTTDETTTKMINSSGQNNWNIHPAFTDGSGNNYANGGWDREIAGFWVAKFEASSSNPTATNGGGDVTTLSVKVLPNVTSWRGITITKCFANCLNMNSNGNIYSIPTNAVTHLMKNSEWGAVAYLTQSKYGRNGTEVTINNSSTYITGNAGETISAGANNGGVTKAYNTETGALASTTGTIYGIYDMSGGAHDIVASALIDAVDTSVITSSSKLFTIVEKSTENTGSANYELVRSKYGDAVYETSLQSYDGANDSTNYKSWNYDYNSFVSADYPLTVRGGKMNSNVNAGIFAYQRNLSAANSGEGSEGLGFRPVIVVE